MKEGPGLASGEIATHTFTFASEKKPDGTIERVPVLLGAAGRRRGATRS